MATHPVINGVWDSGGESGVIVLLSGPNLSLLGERQPEVYGRATLADHVARATAAATRLGFSLEHLQSDHEGEIR